jgi:hypothetical protein
MHTARGSLLISVFQSLNGGCHGLQSIMATCACGDEPGHKFQTFGQLIEEVLAGAETKGSALVRLVSLYTLAGTYQPVHSSQYTSP